MILNDIIMILTIHCNTYNNIYWKYNQH